MKPFRLILASLIAAPAVVPLVSVSAIDAVRQPSLDDAGPSRPRPGAGRFIAVSEPTAWPTASDRIEAGVASIQSGFPIPPPPNPLATTAVVRIGDTLPRISQRYGISLGELLRLNPSLESARLIVGTQLRLARSAAGSYRPLLGLRPTGSGGVSWPDHPSYGDGRHSPGSRPWSGETWSWPAQGVFSSGYGWRWGRMHKGIDVANAEGTPIMAARNGKVTFADWHDGGYGYLVEITHPDGSLTRYGHNSALLVREGDVVQQGQVISRMGSTGRSTGPHLHFEIHLPGQGATNPMQFLPPRA